MLIYLYLHIYHYWCIYGEYCSIPINHLWRTRITSHLPYDSCHTVFQVKLPWRVLYVLKIIHHCVTYGMINSTNSNYKCYLKGGIVNTSLSPEHCFHHLTSEACDLIYLAISLCVQYLYGVSIFTWSSLTCALFTNYHTCQVDYTLVLQVCVQYFCEMSVLTWGSIICTLLTNKPLVSQLPNLAIWPTVSLGETLD